jgi:NitT/TauT family transport system permease protein
MKQIVKNNRQLLISILSIVALFVLWELSLSIFEVSKTVLIKPTVIIQTLFSDTDIILSELFYSITEIIPGWVIGNILGFLLALFVYRKNKISKNLIRLSVLINSIPLIALTAILGGIMGTNRDLKIVIVSLIVFFPMFITTLSQLNSIEKNQKYLMYSYSANQNQILSKILLPKALPAIINSIKVSVTTAIFTAITAEFFGGYGGIGLFILSKKGLYNLKLVWASIFAIAIFGSLFYFTVEFLQKRIVTWQES